MRSLSIPLLLSVSLDAATVQQIRSDAELAKALDRLKPHTTLQIAPGTYRGAWAVAGIDHLTVEAADPENPPLFKGGNQAWQFSRCNRLTVRHLRTSGQKYNGFNIDDGGKRDTPTTHVRLEHLTVTDVGPRGNFDGIKCSGIDQLRITHCTISGWGGQAIDFVGCHNAVISHCTITGKPGYSQTTGPQFKGGSSDITVEHCTFLNAGMRPIQAGGSTGMAYFRPPGATWEARDITIRHNTIIGGMCAVSFTGVDGAEFSRNTIIKPDKWVFRILQETTAPGFPPCRNVDFHHNIISFQRAKVRGVVNLGPNTAPDTFRFHHNLWFASDAPDRSRPNLPAPESDAIHGLDPKLDPTTYRPAAAKARAILKDLLHCLEFQPEAHSVSRPPSNAPVRPSSETSPQDPEVRPSPPGCCLLPCPVWEGRCAVSHRLGQHQWRCHQHRSRVDLP